MEKAVLPVTDKKDTAFHRSRLLACGSACQQCGTVKLFPEGLGLYEEPYCEPVWLCEECYPESDFEEEE